MATKKKASTRTATRAATTVKATKKQKSSKGSYQNYIIIALSLAVVFMSIGFAAFSTSLNIGGTNNVTVKKATWDIHWAGKTGGSETGTVTETKGADLGTVTRTDDTNITFTATLAKPGDEYEFTVDAVNAGTFDASLTSVTMTDISTYSNYLTYTITYDGQTFSNPSNTPSPASTLAAGAQKTATVNVKYIQPANSANLPQSDVTVTLTATFKYDQI